MSEHDLSMEEEFDPFAVTMLIRWLQNHVPGPDGRAPTLRFIAEDILGHNNRYLLDRFLAQNLNKPEQMQRAREYAKKLKPVLDQGRPFPPAIRKLYIGVYGDETFVPIGEGKPVKLPEVVRHRSMANVPGEPADIGPLYGLSLVIRLSNDSIPAPELKDGAELPGWSLSVLNVLPSHVQSGLNHPLFTLRQRALNSNSIFTINGVVITQSDRFVFQGIDVFNRRPFHAYLLVPELWRRYRDKSRETIFGSGMMMGLPSGGNLPFAGLFETFAIPQTSLTVDSSEIEMVQFRELYYQITRESIGVRDLDGTISEMIKLGIRGDAEWLKSVLRTVRDRVVRGKLLKL